MTDRQKPHERLGIKLSKQQERDKNVVLIYPQRCTMSDECKKVQHLLVLPCAIFRIPPTCQPTNFQGSSQKLFEIL